MSTFRKVISAVILTSLLLSACGGLISPNNQEPDSQALVMTAAFETLQAEAADAGTDGDDDGGTEPEATEPQATDPPPTDSPTATNTPIPPTATPTPICNMAQFIDDMTVPDDTVMEPGETFTKVWRIQNTGDCTWTAGYQVIFDDGEQMGAPVSVPLPIVVAPNGTVDISIDMTAPLDEGTHRGDWKLRSADGIEFGLGGTGTFYVQIIVVEPTATTQFLPILPLPITLIPLFGINVEVLSSDSGSVNAGGGMASTTLVGDTSSNLGIQSFFTFDLSGIPAGSTVNNAYIGATGYSTMGDPMAGLGCLRIYDGTWFPLDAGDYDDYTATGAIARFCTYPQLNDVWSDAGLEAAVQAAVGGELEVIVVFNQTETDNDGSSDYVSINDLSLVINYSLP